MPGHSFKTAVFGRFFPKVLALETARGSKFFAKIVGFFSGQKPKNWFHRMVGSSEADIVSNRFDRPVHELWIFFSRSLSGEGAWHAHLGARYDLNLVSFFRNISSKKSKNRSFSRFVDHMADFFGKNWLLSKGGERGEILVPRIAEAVGAAPRAACSQLYTTFFVRWY